MKLTIRIETNCEINVDKIFSFCKDAIQHTKFYNCCYLLDDDRNIIGTIDIDTRNTDMNTQKKYKFSEDINQYLREKYTISYSNEPLTEDNLKWIFYRLYKTGFDDAKKQFNSITLKPKSF